MTIYEALDGGEPIQFKFFGKWFALVSGVQKGNYILTTVLLYKDKIIPFPISIPIWELELQGDSVFWNLSQRVLYIYN